MSVSRTPQDDPSANGSVLLPNHLLDAVYDPDSPINAPSVALWAHIHRNYAWRPLPSLSRLAEETGQSGSSVRRQLRALRAAGEIPWATVRASGYAYGIGAPGYPWVKIGHSKAPEARLADIQVGSPEELTILWKAPGGEVLERHLHEVFRERRGNGEWFDFAGVDAVALISQAAATFEAGE